MRRENVLFLYIKFQRKEVNTYESINTYEF